MHTYPTETATTVEKLSKGWPSLILFGDSITEGIWRQEVGFSFGCAVTQTFSRRFQILERGFSGYNTANARVVADDVIPPTGSSIDVNLVLIFFGANDAVIPGYGQHVDLEVYKRNLKALAQHPNIISHGAKVVIVAPPPFDEHKAYPAQDRKAAVTKQYAEAAAEVAAETGAELLSLWNIYMEYCGWKEGGPLLGDINVPRCPELDELLSDGLHLNPKAYEMYFNAFMHLLKTKIPEIYEAGRIFPYWAEAPVFTE